MQLIHALTWRIKVSAASTGNLIRTITPEDSLQTSQGMIATVEGGTNSCLEASFTASGRLGLPPLSRIEIQITEDNTTWHNIFRGELIIQPNKWSVEAGYYNLSGYRKRFYEIPLPNRTYIDGDIGTIVRHVLYDISGIGGGEFGQLLQPQGGGEPVLGPPLPPLAGALIGPHINILGSEVPNTGKTIPALITNAELVGAFFEKIEAYYEDAITPTKFGVDRNGTFSLKPVNQDVLDLETSGYEYAIDWPSIQNERPITCILWFLGQYEDSKQLITYEYKEQALVDEYGARYKRLVLKNSQPFYVPPTSYKLFQDGVMLYDYVASDPTFTEAIKIKKPANSMVIPTIGADVDEKASYFELVPEDDYIRVWIDVSVGRRDGRFEILRTNPSTSELELVTVRTLQYQGGEITGPNTRIRAWVEIDGKAGDSIRLWDSPDSSTDDQDVKRAVLTITSAYVDSVDSDLLDRYSKIHISTPNTDPAEVKIRGVLLDCVGRIKVPRPDGTYYERNITQIEYTLSGDEWSKTVIKVEQSEDLFKKAQAIAIEVRDEQALIEAYAGNFSFKSGN